MRTACNLGRSGKKIWRRKIYHEENPVVWINHHCHCYTSVSISFFFTLFLFRFKARPLLAVPHRKCDALHSSSRVKKPLVLLVEILSQFPTDCSTSETTSVERDILGSQSIGSWDRYIPKWPIGPEQNPWPGIGFPFSSYIISDVLRCSKFVSASRNNKKK